MKRRKKYDTSTITFTLTKAGCREGAPVTLTGEQFSNLAKRMNGRKVCPLTEPEAQAAALFVDFGPRRGARRRSAGMSEYEAPDGVVWVCGACGRHGKDRTSIGDVSCFLNAVLCFDRQPWVAVDPAGGRWPDMEQIRRSR